MLGTYCAAVSSAVASARLLFKDEEKRASRHDHGDATGASSACRLAAWRVMSGARLPLASLRWPDGDIGAAIEELSLHRR